MKIEFNLKFKESNSVTYQPNLSTSDHSDDIRFFNDIKISGLPDQISGKYKVDSIINIKDSMVKSITSNNIDTINVKTFKTKNTPIKKNKEYEVTFNKLGNGSLCIENLSGQKRTFGLFTGFKNNSLKFGMKFERGEKYEKFWETRHVNFLYKSFTIDNLNDIIYFIKFSLSHGSIPVLILNNTISVMNEYFNILDTLVSKCLYYTTKVGIQLFIITEPKFVNSQSDVKIMKSFIKGYNNLYNKYTKTNLQLVYPLEMQSLSTSLDCTRTLGHLQGLEEISKTALKCSEKLLFYGINNDWLIGFNSNYIDSYCNKFLTLKFNNDITINYLFYIKKITDCLQTEGMLYNIPTGLLNKNDKVYHTNTRCDYEDGSIIFLLGGKFVTNNPYYKENLWNDPNMSINGDQIIINSHEKMILKSNIKYILFGSELNEGTTSSYSPHSVGKCIDKEHLINKIKTYESKI